MRIEETKTTDSKEEVGSYANEIIESLKAVKFSSTIHYSDEKQIVEKIYDVAYKIIQLEIITLGHSQVYEYIKNYDIDTYFLDRCIRKDIESLNLKDDNNKKIKEKTYELSRNELYTNYFDIELIKLLMCNSNNIDLKDNIIEKLNNLKKEINDTVNVYDRTLPRYNYSFDELHRRLIILKNYRKDIFKRVTSTIVSLSIVVGGFLGINTLMKKLSTGKVYPKTTTTYSNEYGKEVLDGYSFVENKEQDSTYIYVYTNWYDDFWRDEIKDIYTYDVSNVDLENIEDYLNLNYTELDANKETVSLRDGKNLPEKGYVEVEKITIDRSKEEYTNNDIYILFSIWSYSLYIGILAVIEYKKFDKYSDGNYLGIINNMYQLFENNIKDYKKDKGKSKMNYKNVKVI